MITEYLPSQFYANNKKHTQRSRDKNTTDLPSEMSRSRISHANIVGFSRLYCSIFDTTAGVATFGLEPPIKPGGRSVPVNRK